MIDQASTLRSILNVSHAEATRHIVEAVDESVWESLQIPKRLRERAAKRIAATLDAFLSTSVSGLVSGALAGCRELAMYADDRDHEVDEFELSVASEHEPSVDLKVNGFTPQTVTFPVAVSIKFSGATLVIRRGRVMAMRTGRCVVAGTLHCEEVELFKRAESPFKIRSDMQFGEGIPIRGPRR
jgi:hypothetical protein